jgi:hypothetical protein
MTIYVYGDQTEAAKYRSTVEHYLGELTRTFGNVSKNQSYWRQLSDTAKVHLRLINGQPFAYIYTEGAGYMESGILDLLNLAPLNADTYKPAIVRLTDRVSGLMPTYPDASKKRTLEDGNESYAVGEKEKKGHQDVFNRFGDLIAAFDSDPPEFCATVDIIARKEVVNKFPPSIFTGRMRDYVQALYGTKRTDFYADLADDEFRFDLGERLDDKGMPVYDALGNPVRDFIQIAPRAPTGCGIYELPNKKFAMVHFSASGLKIYARMLHSVGTPVMPASSELDSKITDSYLFATLRPSDVALEIGEIDPDFNKYSPRAYGWHFNREGTKAVLAGQETVVIMGQLNTGASQSIAGWNCALLEMTINLSLDDEGNLSGTAATVIKEGPIPFIPNEQTAIYSPFYALGGMTIWNESIDVYIDSTDAPIYAYYDSTSTLVVVRASESTLAYESSYALPSGDGSVIGTFGYMSTYLEWSGDNSRSQSYTSSGGSITIAEHTYSGLLDWAGFRQTSWMTLTTGTEQEGTLGHPGYVDGVWIDHDPYTYCEFNLGELSPSTELDIVNSYHRKVPFIIIPWLDSQAVFSGISSVVTGELSAVKHNGFGNHVNVLVNGTLTNGLVALMYGPTGADTYDWPIEWPEPNILPKSSGELYLHKNGTQELVGTEGTLIPRLGILSFNPKTGYLDTEFIHKSSMGEATMYAIPNYFFGYKDWPDDLNVDGGPIGYA